MDNLKEFILSVLFLPILLSAQVFKSERGLLKKIVLVFVVWIFIGGTWIRGYRNLFSATNFILYETGVSDKQINIPVKGESMLPTIKDGEHITLHSPKKYKIERGDIVSFQNIETGGLYYLKRVIGLPGEKISIKNGTVYINGRPLAENYTYNNRPTYGNTFLIDCETYIIPQGKIAVMGDNRIVSADSRIIGFIAINDVDGVIKTHMTPVFTSTLTNAPTHKTINVQAFVDALNLKRKAAGVSPLLVQPVLSDVASTRAKYISSNLNTWKDNRESLTTILDQKAYDYLIVQEVTTMGNYTENELVDHVLGLIPYNYDFLSNRYYEVGVGESIAAQGECQIPVIDIILSWPTKPSNSQQIADAFSKDIDVYTNIITALKKLKSTQGIDASETQNLIDSLTALSNEADRLRLIVLENRWFTSQESNQNKNYQKKAAEIQQKLADYVRKNQKYFNDPSLGEFLSDYKWGNKEFNDESYRAKLLFSQGKYQELLESAKKLLKLAKNNDEKAIGYYWQGLAYYSLKNDLEAEKSELNAIQYNPDYAAAYSTLSAISFNKKDYQKGLQYATKCKELDDKYPWCYNNLAIAYFNLGQKNKAIEEMEKAVSLAPESFVFNENLKRMKAGL